MPRIQEAVHGCIGLPEASNAEIFINTSRAGKSDLTEIIAVGFLDRYVQRLDQLETVCSSDFASIFKYVERK